jgi:hypothetical protein
LDLNEVCFYPIHLQSLQKISFVMLKFLKYRITCDDLSKCDNLSIFCFINM